MSLTIDASQEIVTQFEVFATQHGLNPAEALRTLLDSYDDVDLEELSEDDLVAVGRGIQEAEAGLGMPLEKFIAERRKIRESRRAA